MWNVSVTSTNSQRPPIPPRGDVEDVDYYRILGVPYTATRAEITRAYRKAMKRVHPDRQPPSAREAAEQHARLLNRAYSTLAHTESRRAYDMSIKAQAVQDQIMSQYFGGFGMPGSGDLSGERFRQPPTAADRRNQKRNDRNAMVSIVVVFAGATVAVVALLVIWAAASSLFRALF